MPTLEEMVQGQITAFKAEYPAIAQNLVLPDGLPGDEDFPLFVEQVDPHPQVDYGTGAPLVIGTFGAALYADVPTPGYTNLYNLASSIGYFVHRNSFGIEDARPATFAGITIPQVEVEQDSFAIAVVRWQQVFTLENAAHDFSQAWDRFMRLTVTPPYAEVSISAAYIQDDLVNTRVYQP